MLVKTKMGTKPFAGVFQSDISWIISQFFLCVNFPFPQFLLVALALGSSEAARQLRANSPRDSVGTFL